MLLQHGYCTIIQPMMLLNPFVRRRIYRDIAGLGDLLYDDMA
jgi:hypothetical protein